jgi:NAD(P)-dependent dehydrogenase (short-subunit alcohol dehydrogenase family)
MRIAVIGATGTIGSAVADALEAKQHEVVRVGHSSGQYRVDYGDPASIERLCQSIGRLDAVISATGMAGWGKVLEIAEPDMRLGFDNKLLGQIQLVRQAVPIVNDGGVITLSAGLASRRTYPGFSTLSAVNAGLEAFVRGACQEMPRGIRLNVVSPGAVLETMEKMGADTSRGTPASVVARTYVETIEQPHNGAVLDVGYM